MGRKEYSISLRNILRTTFFTLIVVLVFVPVIFKEIFSQSGNQTIITSLSIVVGVISLPSIAMLLNYIIANTGYKVVIDSNKKELEITLKGNKVLLKDSDIKQIKVFGQKDTDEKQFFRTAWSEYHYYEIILYSGKSYSISSILLFDMEKRYPSELYNYEYKFFPFIEL